MRCFSSDFQTLNNHILYYVFSSWIINEFEKFQSMSIIAIRYNRRQETVLMPKLSLKQQNLEFNWHVRRQVLACKQVDVIHLPLTLSIVIPSPAAIQWTLIIVIFNTATNKAGGARSAYRKYIVLSGSWPRVPHNIPMITFQHNNIQETAVTNLPAVFKTSACAFPRACLYDCVLCESVLGRVVGTIHGSSLGAGFSGHPMV